MAGFQTTHDQQQIRRFLRWIPVRVFIYACGGLGWQIAPPAVLSETPRWLPAAAQLLLLVHIAVIEFGMALQTEALWRGPTWARRRHPRRLWLGPVCLAALAFGVGLGLHWSFSLDNPTPLLGVLLVAAVLAFGTIRQTLRQPVERNLMGPQLASDQVQLMTALSSRGRPPENEGELRSVVLAALIDHPDNRAGRILAWQLAIKADDLSDAAHHIEHLRRVEFPEAELAEMDGLLALVSDEPGRAAEALTRRVEFVHRNPRTTPAGQRADFVAVLHLAHALVCSTDWERAAQCLDALALDYESAPFVGQIDRLIVNHMRWRAAHALRADETVREIGERCRRFANRSVRSAERRLVPRADRSGVPEALRWWPQAARAALQWWEEMRTG